MIHKRLSPEERRGVFAVLIISLLLMLLGFCHKCFRGGYSHDDGQGDSISVREITGADSLSGQQSADSISRYEEDGEESRRGSKRGNYKSHKQTTGWSERDYLTDTIP